MRVELLRFIDGFELIDPRLACFSSGGWTHPPARLMAPASSGETVPLPGSRSTPQARAHGATGRLAVSRGSSRMIAAAVMPKTLWGSKSLPGL